MFTAFQPSAFQSSAYQIVQGENAILMGGGPGTYTNHWENKLRRESQEARRKELSRLEEKISSVEEKLSKERVLTKREEEFELHLLSETEENLRKEINRLRMVRVWLMRLIDDEEAIFVLLASWPLH